MVTPTNTQPQKNGNTATATYFSPPGSKFQLVFSSCPLGEDDQNLPLADALKKFCAWENDAENEVKYVMSMMRSFEIQELFFQMLMEQTNLWYLNKNTQPKPIYVLNGALAAYRLHMKHLLLKCVVPNGLNNVGSIVVGEAVDVSQNEPLIKLAYRGLKPVEDIGVTFTLEPRGGEDGNQLIEDTQLLHRASENEFRELRASDYRTAGEEVLAQASPAFHHGPFISGGVVLRPRAVKDTETTGGCVQVRTCGGGGGGRGRERQRTHRTQGAPLRTAFPGSLPPTRPIG